MRPEATILAPLLVATLAGALSPGVLRPPPAAAEERAVGGDVETGRRLLAENGCDGSCHRNHSPDDDPIDLYTRSTRKVQSRAELRRQVEFCVSQLNSMIFPEDIGSVAAALDHDHYHFE